MWPDPAAIELKLNLLRALNQADQPERALEVADAVLEVAEHGDLIPFVARGLVGRGAALGSLGRLREGIALIRAGADIARDNEFITELRHRPERRGLPPG